ncbi:DNA-binding MarR family transcriptional regulator [Microbacterium sp. SLBN-154]|uniref:MarR family winged helix-turn-helix transcriptional regulator n=1 Tax=Microbacterium sp. SLBN-154 TaxID=2768458 RepID=UPI001152AF4A|nr:MarR family transcriptional regulator [Microbacterium sp. SLBN-154]TQK17546.1 DNA-binding MarR family transcriptional regulator [Microbacterium sp. SLBN-154]
MDDRDTAIGRVLEGVVSARRLLGDARRRPFASLMLTTSQLEAMFLLSHTAEPVTPGRLAQRLGITAGAVTQLVDGLRKSGLVEQAPHPTDARSRVIRLSPSARAEVDVFEAGVVAEMRRHFAGLSEAELIVLGDLLSRVGDGVSPQREG